MLFFHQKWYYPKYYYIKKEKKKEKQNCNKVKNEAITSIDDHFQSDEERVGEKDSKDVKKSGLDFLIRTCAKNEAFPRVPDPTPRV